MPLELPNVGSIANGLQANFLRLNHLSRYDLTNIVLYVIDEYRVQSGLTEILDRWEEDAETATDDEYVQMVAEIAAEKRGKPIAKKTVAAVLLAGLELVNEADIAGAIRDPEEAPEEKNQRLHDAFMAMETTYCDEAGYFWKGPRNGSLTCRGIFTYSSLDALEEARGYVTEVSAEEAREMCPHDTDAAGNCRFGCGYNGDQAQGEHASVDALSVRLSEVLNDFTDHKNRFASHTSLVLSDISNLDERVTTVDRYAASMRGSVEALLAWRNDWKTKFADVTVLRNEVSDLRDEVEYLSKEVQKGKVARWTES